MRNPLRKRIPKELVSEWHKYLVIVVFMVLMIGVISGMYIGHDSMLAAIEEGRTNLNLEDGSFVLKKKADEEFIAAVSTGDMADVRQYFIDEGIDEADREVSEALEEARNSDEFAEAVEDAYEEAHNAVIEAVDEEWEDIVSTYNLDDESFEPVPITVTEHFYRNLSEDFDNDGEEDATVRVFESDAEVDMASFLEGRAPQTEDEIAIDRMHAENVGIGVGDTITVGGRQMEVVGLLSYVNYLTLHESNTDLMFDAFGFDVGMVTPDAFSSFTSRLHYEYAYFYVNEPADKIEQADYADNLLKALITQTVVADNEIEDFLPEYVRQASNFAPSDIEGDSTGSSILCYILIAVIAFIFAITISNTIEKEASVIGTLRASGYTKDELAVHYMSMPLIVTLIGAVLGNILGYTAFRRMAIYLYYNSYSLPSCGIVFSPVALVKTTVIPLLLMFFINLFIIVKRLQLSPLRFLRHDLSKSKRSKARRIPAWSFIRRFRLRIVFQNISNYVVLVFGLIFIELMLCFAFGLPDSLIHYGEVAPEMVFADYQYMLMGSEDDDGNLIVTSEESAERFSSASLLYPKSGDAMFEGRGSGGDETVTVYGIEDGSSYIELPEDMDQGHVYISSAFAAKFDLTAGTVITLNEEYENKSYEFTVDGIIDYDGGIAVFMRNECFNTIFEKDEDEFSGYFSRNEITDIDDKNIATVITQEDITKITTQLMHSMGGFMNVFKYALIVLSAALIYLLAKIIIERNEHAISMVKILGFTNGEVGSLYIVPTALIVTAVTVISFIAGRFLMTIVFKIFMLQMDGYFAFFMKPSSMLLSMAYLLIGYLFVSLIDFARIKKIPLDVALKNVE